MAELITVRPKQGSKRFRAINGLMTQYQKITENNQEEERATGEYKSERFPNSRQMFRPVWSASRRMWMLKGFENMDDKKHQELNKLVAACKLKYSDKHPNAKQYITTADVYDSADPFFNHHLLRVITYEGQASLDKSRPIDKILLAGLSADHTFQQGGEKINPVLSQRVKYVITDKNIDTQIKKETRTLTVQATKLYAGLTDAKKMKIALALALISNENVDRGIIDEVLWDASQDNKSMMGGTRLTKQKAFIQMCEADTEELNIRHKIQRAKATGKLKKHKTQGYLLFGNPIATTDGKLYEYFSDPANQEIMIRLEQALEND